MKQALVSFGEVFRRQGLALAILLISGPIFAQTNFSTVFSNGPTATRLNILILSEGYTAAQLPQFLIDATNRVNDFLAEEPYREYRSYFNGFATFVASAQSGSDHPNQNYYRNTYFNSSYATNETSPLVTIPTKDIAKVEAFVEQFLPQCDIPILLVNDLKYGGSGGSVLIVSRSTSSAEIIRHESGHTLGRLGDEYDLPNPGYPDDEEPNTTRETRRDFIKWRDWVANDTPIPTPSTDAYANVIGLFEGAHYHDAGWYRPKSDCKMRTLSSPFCEICREALVKAIYARVLPFDSYSPLSTNFEWSATESLEFSVQPFQPLTHALDTRWYTDGSAVVNATGTDFTLRAGFFGNGRHTVMASVHDNTPWVRTNPSALLQHSVNWTLDIGSSDLRLVSLAATNFPKYGFGFEVFGTGSTRFAIQSSTNLSDWAFLATNNLNAGQFTFFDTNASSMMRAFYRAVSLP